MPIKIADNLPAVETLSAEGVPLIRETDAIRQDIRPLKIGLLNLMPEKARTETQFARLLGATPLQIELRLLYVSNHEPKTTPKEHMISFYEPWPTVKDEKFDGLIVTGAPIETLPFEEVTYWEELTRIFDWTQTNVHSTFDICWGAQAALYHFHGVPKYQLSEKAFGVFRHQMGNPRHHLLRGFNDAFNIPVSRHTEVHAEDIVKVSDLELLAWSDDSGVCLVEDRKRRHVCMFNHLEYDWDTLKNEYDRDSNAGLPIKVPANYFPNNDPKCMPVNTWRTFAHLLIANWVNEIYQTTPYDLEQIGAAS